MNKVNYFRNRIKEQYRNNELANAAASGEALLQEHLHNRVCRGMGYADDMYNLALIYEELSVEERAVELYAESARLTYAEEGESPSFVCRLNNLAALLNKLGRCESAYRLYSHMTTILRETVEADSTDLADGLYNLGNAAADLDRREEALRLHEEALAIREKTGRAIDIVNSLHSLALLYEAESNQEEAVHYAETAVERAAGTDAYHSACYYLAGLYDAEGRREESIPLFESVLKWIERTASRTHSAYISVAARLASTLTDAKEYDQALAIQERLCETLIGKSGKDHIFYAECLRNRAILCGHLNKPDEAETHMLKALKIKKRVMGEHARDITHDAVFLMDLYINGGKPDKALDMLVYALMQTGEKGTAALLERLSTIFSRAGTEQFNHMLSEIEKLNDPGRLWMIIRQWTDWESQED